MLRLAGQFALVGVSCPAYLRCVISSSRQGSSHLIDGEQTRHLCIGQDRYEPPYLSRFLSFLCMGAADLRRCLSQPVPCDIDHIVPCRCGIVARCRPLITLSDTACGKVIGPARVVTLDGR